MRSKLDTSHVHLSFIIGVSAVGLGWVNKDTTLRSRAGMILLCCEMMIYSLFSPFFLPYFLHTPAAFLPSNTFTLRSPCAAVIP